MEGSSSELSWVGKLSYAFLIGTNLTQQSKWPWFFHHSQAPGVLCVLSMGFSLVVLTLFHLFYIMLFTTLPNIDMDFEDLSILKTKKSSQLRVVEVSDSPNFDKVHQSSIAYKP